MKKLMFTLACLIFGVGLLTAQTSQVTGVVTAQEDGLPVVGASVLVVGTNLGSITDIDGKFSISNVPSTAKALRISYVGMIPQEVAIKSGNVKVSLQSDAKALDEVVVTALGISREKKALGYSVQEVGAADLTKGGQLNVGSALSGKVAGLQVTQAGGAVGSSQRIVVRGNSSFGNNQPLIVVDGIPIINDQASSNARGNETNNNGGSLDLGSGLNDINPDDIESISVLKGGSAALYGMRAGNGVILITTKSGKKKSNGISVSYNMDFTVDRVFNLPKLQNKYGQGNSGSEYHYNTGGYTDEDTGQFVAYKDKYPSYADYATNVGFNYVDGKGSGVNDNDDESWGPRLDIGLMIPQFNSPVVNGVRQATPWVSHPDNIKDFFQTGTSQNHNLSITSVKENSTIRASLGYRKQIGTVPNTDLRKITGQMNATFNVNKYVDFDMSMNYTNTNSGNLIATGYTASNPMQSLLQWFGRQVDMKALKENYDKLDENGNRYNWNQSFHVNPYYNVYNNPNKYDRNRFFGKASLFVKPFEFLKVEGRLGYDMFNSNINSEISFDTDHVNGWFRNIREVQKELNADVVVYYNQHFGKLSVNGLVGANYRDVTMSQSAQGAGSEGLTVQKLFTMSNVQGAPYTNFDHSHIRSNSVYGNVSLGWDSQVYLDVSARNDWSSTIKDAFFYPSFGMSWIPTATFKSIQSDVLNYLKVRASWAKVGNATTAYQIGKYYSADDYTINGNSQFYKPTTAPYAELKPEKILTYEFGAEATLLKNRLRLDVTYYNKVTSDQIMTVEVPRSTGYSRSLINAGKVQNRGVELQISGDIIQNPNGFSWTASFNWAKDKSTIKELAEGLDTYTLNSNWAVYNYAKVGETWGTLYGAGFTYDDNGSIIIGSNGLPKLTANQKIGKVTPDWTGGFRNDFSYKNWTLGVLLDFRKGGDFFSVTQMFGAQTGILEYTAAGDVREKGIIIGKDVLADKKFVLQDGSENNIRVSAQNFYQSYYSNKQLDIADGSYLKLREINLTYTFPKVLLEKTKFIQAAHVSFIANNVAILALSKHNQAKIDPESSISSGNDGVGFESNSVPPTRSFGIKLGVTF